MLRRKFDLNRKLNGVFYLRMSDLKQNELSPEQQDRMIRSRIKRCGMDVTIIKTYRDDGETGRMIRNRKGFLAMMDDIESGRIKVDAIFVDTIERFGRMEDLDERRRRLEQEHGVLILTADKSFADPTSSQGRVMTMFENYRSIVDSEIKAHNVLRSKYLMIDQKFWPGGPVPFGYKLHLVERIEKPGVRTVLHHHLVPDPVTGPIMASLFQKSKEEPNWGQDRLAVWLNERPDIPNKFKNFIGDTIGKQLANDIYHGELVWDQNCTGIIRGVRIVEPNAEEDIIHVPDFCEPLVSLEDFNLVQAYRKMRSNHTNARTSPRQRGISYRYPLTGLVRCAHCNAAMNPNSSAPYKGKDGVARTYAAYACPNRRNGSCPNRGRVPEDWLRSTVIDSLVQRLIPVDPEQRAQFIDEIKQMVSAELDERHREDVEIKPVLEIELAELQQQISGWCQSLGKPDLPDAARNLLESQLSDASERSNELRAMLVEQPDKDLLLSHIVSVDQINGRLDCLAEVLGGDCATETNLFLSMHIDRIDCFEDGRIQLRVCKIGSAYHAVRWFGERQDAEHHTAETDSPSGHQTKPRRRGRPRVRLDDSVATLEEIDAVLDPHRFCGLPEDWFWVDEFRIPEKTCWSQENADAVLARYQELEQSDAGKPSCNAIAKEFNVSRPTILKALDYAQQSSDEPITKHRRQSKVKVKGNPEVESRIAELHDAGVLEKDIAAEIGVSRAAITAALIRLYEDRDVPKPDGRKTRHQKQ